MEADPHALDSDTVFNLRDLGGGRIRPGLVFRSAELSDPGAPDDPVVRGLGLRTVVDLRTAAEVEQRPDHVPAGVLYEHRDVLADVQSVASGRAHLMTDPAAFVEQVGAGDPHGEMESTYRRLVSSSSASVGYAAALRAVVAAGGEPVLIHCTAGKDRTGWAATVLLHLAGAELDEIWTEYLSVNPAVRAAFGPLIEMYVRGGGDPAALTPMLEVRPEYLSSAFDEVSTRFGDLSTYVRQGLGLTDDEIDTLARLLTTA
jgi:protein-tyrosine phosphatase